MEQSKATKGKKPFLCLEMPLIIDLHLITSFAPKFAKKSHKFAGPIHFQAHVCEKNITHQNLPKVSQICQPE